MLEFDGGALEVFLQPAQAGLNVHDPIHGPAGAKAFRPPPASFPQARLPTQASPERTYDIKYYSRDVRRNLPAGENVPVDRSIAPAFLVGPALEPGVPPPSTGAKMAGVWFKDEEGRYDKTGLRNTMTASDKALAKELERHRPNHVPDASKGATKRMGLQRKTLAATNPWAYTHQNEW